MVVVMVMVVVVVVVVTVTTPADDRLRYSFVRRRLGRRSRCGDFLLGIRLI